MPLSRAMRISWSRVIVRTSNLRSQSEISAPIASRSRASRSRSRASSRSIAARSLPSSISSRSRAAAICVAPMARPMPRTVSSGGSGISGSRGRERDSVLPLGRRNPSPEGRRGSSPPRQESPASPPALPPALASEVSSGSLFRPAASAAASRSLTTALSTNASSTERAFGASSARFVCVCFGSRLGLGFRVSDGRASRFSTAARVSASNARRSSCTCAAHAAATAHVPGPCGSKPLAAYATPYRAAHRRYLCALRARASSSGSRLDPATSPPIAGRNHAANPKRGKQDTAPATPQRRPESSSSESGESTGLCAWKSALRAGRARSAAEPRPRSTPEPTSRFSALDAPPASAATARATNLARVARLPRGCATRVPLQGRRRQAAAAARTEALAEGVARIAHAVGAIADPSDDPCAPSRATNDGRVVVCRVRETARARPAFLESTSSARSRFEKLTKNPYGPITYSKSTIFEKAKAQERCLFHDLRAARAAEPAAPAFGAAPR